MIVGRENGNDQINIKSTSRRGIAGNGAANYSDITINTTGTIEGAKAGIYNSQVGKLTINSGTIKATSEQEEEEPNGTAIEIRAGELEVNGGTIQGSSSAMSSSTPHGSGTTSTGAGIAVVQHNTQKAIKVTVNDGDISGYTALWVGNPQECNAFDSEATAKETNPNDSLEDYFGEKAASGTGRVVGTVTVDVKGGKLTSAGSGKAKVISEGTTRSLQGYNAVVNFDERVTIGLSGTEVNGYIAADLTGRTGDNKTGYAIGSGNTFKTFTYDESKSLLAYYTAEDAVPDFNIAVLAQDNGWIKRAEAENTWDYTVTDNETTKVIATFAPKSESTEILELTTADSSTNTVNLDLSEALFSDLFGDESQYKTIDASAVTNAGLAFNITGNDKITSILGGAGADSLTAGAANVTLNGGDGDDSLVGGSGNDMFVITKGSDTIVNYDSANDNVSIGAGLTAPTGFDKATFTNGNFVISLSASSDSLTFENTSEFSLKDASDTYYYKANSNGIESIAKNTDGITLGAGFGKGSYDGSKLTYKTIDAQAVTVGGGLKITGNDEDSTLIGASTGGEIKGGYGNDELQASATSATVTTILDGDIGNDLLKGSTGADTFVYSAGKDSIQSYAAGDLVSVKGLNPVDAAYSVAESGSNISLDFGGGDLLVFENVIENGVSLKGSGGNYIYTKDYYAVNDRSVTLAENYNKPVEKVNTFDASGTNFRTIDAAAVSTAVSVMGNTLNNKIFGSKAGGTLNGGDGNDTFDLSERTTTGGGVSYVFQYTAGKDVVDGFVKGDKLEIDDTLVAGITSGKASDGKLAFNFSNESNALTFLSANDDLNAVSLQSSNAFLTKDGVVSLDASDSASFKLFANAKGRIDLTDAPYKGADIKTVDARAVKNQSVTLVSGTQGGAFTFSANNRKKDMFEYGGGSVTITNYEAGNDRLNLGAASISGFEITNGNADVKLTVDSDKVISLVGAAQHEILIHDANSKSNSYSKLVFYDNGVLHNKERRPTEATISAANTTYSAADLPSIKKIFVTNNVSGVNVTAGNNKTTLDASEANGVTFTGGAKNDKFIASKGTDTFVYSAGKDVITGYTSSDIITLGDDELKMESAKITSTKKSLKFKFTNKNALNIKSDDTISSVQIGGGTFNFDKNAIISGGNVTLTSQFSGTFKTDDKDLSTNATYVDGERVTKNLTFKGTTAQETLVGGQKKTTFKGGGGADSLVGGSGKDIFFYAKGDSGTSTIANFDFTKDKVKIANGTIGKISTVTGGGVQFDMTSGKKGDISTTGTFQIKTSATYTDGEYMTSDAFTIDKVLIKANNTYYWFAEAAGNDINDKAYASGALITHDTKISKTAASGYAVIDLGYSTNLVKSGVAVKVASTGENAVSLPEKD